MVQPELPGCIEWCDETVSWWRHLSSDPRTADFLAVDWDALMMAAILHHVIWAQGDVGRIRKFDDLCARHGL